MRPKRNPTPHGRVIKTAVLETQFDGNPIWHDLSHIRGVDEFAEKLHWDVKDEEVDRAFHIVLERTIGLPFKAKVVGETVEVVGLEVGQHGLAARCVRRGKVWHVPLVALHVPESAPQAEWLELYDDFHHSRGAEV